MLGGGGNGFEPPSRAVQARALPIELPRQLWDCGEPVVEPGQWPGELHARRATPADQPRLWLVVHVRIIGFRDGIGNIVRRASVGATSVVADRARVRPLQRIRTVRISRRPAQTAAVLVEACGQASSHPRIGGRAAPSPGLSEQACIQPTGDIRPHRLTQILQPHEPKS